MDARDFAIRANEEELLLEANLLLSEMALARGSVSDAKRYAHGAAEVRERLASRVRGAVRQSFLNRPDCRNVDVLLCACDAVPPESSAPTSSPRRAVPVDVPPLRDRGTDVLVLAQHVLDELQAEGGPARRFSVEAKRLLSRDAWPGNVRELQNVVRAAAILSDGATIEETDLAEHLQRSPHHAHDAHHAERGATVDSVHAEVDVVRSVYEAMRHSDLPLPDLKRRIEQGCIALAMVDAGGQITRAAGYLGMKRPRVSQLVKTYGLKMDDDKEA